MKLRSTIDSALADAHAEAVAAATARANSMNNMEVERYGLKRSSSQPSLSPSKSPPNVVIDNDLQRRRIRGKTTSINNGSVDVSNIAAPSAGSLCRGSDVDGDPIFPDAVFTSEPPAVHHPAPPVVAVNEVQYVSASSPNLPGLGDGEDQ